MSIGFTIVILKTPIAHPRSRAKAKSFEAYKHPELRDAAFLNLETIITTALS